MAHNLGDRFGHATHQVHASKDLLEIAKDTSAHPVARLGAGVSGVGAAGIAVASLFGITVGLPLALGLGAVAAVSGIIHHNTSKKT